MYTVIVDHPGPLEPTRYFEYGTHKEAVSITASLTGSTKVPGTSPNGEVTVTGIHRGSVEEVRGY